MPKYLDEDALTYLNAEIGNATGLKAGDVAKVILKCARKSDDKKISMEDAEFILREIRYGTEESIIVKLFKRGENTQRLNELRKLLPDKYQVVDSYGNKIGNIAYSISDIEGYEIEELKSFSKYGSKGKNGIKNPMDGWVSLVDNPAYSNDVLKINSNNEIDAINGYLRNNDTEYKIIEKYHQILQGDYEVEGKITIVSERDICPSCDNVIKAFSGDYSNIEIKLIAGTGKMYSVKNGVVQ